MAIIRFDFDRMGLPVRYISQYIDGLEVRKAVPWPEGAYCPVGGYNEPSHRYKHGALVQWHEYVGMCLSDHERNGYDDSDFYMTVWTGNGTKQIEYASTRGWSYPAMGSYVDATPEVRAAYNAWAIQRQREQQVSQKLSERTKALTLAAAHNINSVRLRKLARGLNSQQRQVLEDLLSKNLRSAFRIKMRDAIIAWLRDNSPKYPNPLSPRQWDSMTQHLPTRRRYF